MRSSNNHGEQIPSKIALASISATVAESATFPIDITKTRLQLHAYPLASSASFFNRPKTTAFRVVSDIIRNEGVLGLYKGLSPAILRHICYTPIRIVGYEYSRNAADFGEGSLTFSMKALLGGLSGVFAQVVVSPADLVKVRMQSEGRTGIQPRYTGPFDALTKIARTEGLSGLWKGVLPNVQRAFLVNMGDLACYDQAKRFIIRNEIAGDNIYGHTLASVMSGFSATALSCPADVVKTRMMNLACGGGGGRVVYEGSMDCVMKTLRNEGVRAMYKGFFPTWARFGPWQCVFWVSYEKFRSLAGLSSF